MFIIYLMSNMKHMAYISIFSPECGFTININKYAYFTNEKSKV